MTKYLATVYLTEVDLRQIQGGLDAAQFAICKYICSMANDDTDKKMSSYDAIRESETIFKIYKK